MAAVAPDVISSFGFARAPISQFLVIASGISSVTVALLPRQYQSLFSLRWLDIMHKKQIWRLVTSQLIVDNSTDIVSSCILIYYFLVLERRFGSLKYMSFIFKTWSLSLGLYFTIMKFNLLGKYVPNIEVVPSGLYGPLFALLVQYYWDIPKGENAGPLGLPISRKIFVYLIALQMPFSSQSALLISTCGIVSGIVYRLNILNIQNWGFPKSVRTVLSNVFSYFVKNKSKTISKRTSMGATAEIHEDMMFDYMLKRQQQGFRRGNGNNSGGRNQLGQGYSDVINPSFFNFFQPPPPAAQVDSESSNANETPSSDEKIRTLVDMGFSRGAVIHALASTNNDIQQATSILLSPQ